jgi:hypothetical protein
VGLRKQQIGADFPLDHNDRWLGRLRRPDKLADLVKYLLARAQSSLQFLLALSLPHSELEKLPLALRCGEPLPVHGARLAQCHNGNVASSSGGYYIRNFLGFVQLACLGVLFRRF